jgi:hypothetical protein
MSKGSSRRPTGLSQDEWINRWDAIFGKDLEKKKAAEEALDELIEHLEEKQAEENK